MDDGSFDALAMVVWADGHWLPRELKDNEATRCLITGDLAPLLRFLRAIASGELAEEDFRGKED